MKQYAIKWQYGLGGGLLLLFLLWLTSLLGKPAVGQIDFRAYWSAAYLLGHSQDFTDPSLMLQIERAFTNHNAEWVLMTWNLPWMIVLFVPYTWFSFDQATWLWILTNIFLVFTGTVWFWQTMPASDKKSWVPLLIAVLFAPTMFVFIAGQVGSLVFVGLAGFLYFYSREQDKTAGSLLILALMKPHIVYLVLPLALLSVVRNRRWGVLLGFGGGILGLCIMTFVLRPQFIGDYWHTMAREQSKLLSWENATLGGIIATLGWGHSLKWVGLVLVPLFCIIWWRFAGAWDMKTVLLLTLPVAVFTAPFGWAYDQIVLLLLLLQIVNWFLLKQISRNQIRLLALILFGANGFAFYLRWITVSDSYYVYYTLVLAFVFYLVAWQSDWHTIKVRNGA